MDSNNIRTFAELKLRWHSVTTTDIGNIRPYRVHLYDAVVCRVPHLTEKSVFADTVSIKKIFPAIFKKAMLTFQR